MESGRIEGSLVSVIPVIADQGLNRITLDFFGSEEEASEFAIECAEILRARGLLVSLGSLSANPLPGSAIACLLNGLPSAAQAKALGNSIAKQAQAGMPTVVYMPPLSGKVAAPDKHTACVALLRSRGALITSDPEVWIESAILLSAYGIPAGPQVAIVAPLGSWLDAAALGQRHLADRLGQRFSPLHHDHDSLSPTDTVLIDLASYRNSDSSSGPLVIPVSGKEEREGNRPVLVGLGNALRAAELCGHAAARIAAGDGPADQPLSTSDNEIDHTRFANQEAKLREIAGDHESKVLLSSYGVPITRQAVATTPSAATRIAKKAGYPVQIKGWGPDQATEAEGCTLITDIETASEVRRAFATVCAESDCDAVIVRATPMSGRELRLSIRSMGALGLVAFLYQRGRGEAAAALAPLRPIDAQAMARQVVASRDGDDDPDWQSLSDLLIRASHLVADNPRVQSLDLSRVVVGKSGEGSIVIDARAELSNK